MRHRVVKDRRARCRRTPPGASTSPAATSSPTPSARQIAVLGGSVAQGVADRWSDIDTLVYWDEIDRDWLETPRAAENGERFTWVEHYPGNACLEQYRFGTVKADVAHVRLGWLDELIDGVMSGENTDTTSLDVLRGVQESIVLFGEERYEPIRARVLEYPEALRRSMVEAHLKFTPSWIYDGMGRDRGDLVVFYEYVLATMRNVVGVLAGLNRVYVAPDKLKRVGAVVSRMELTPPDAAATARRAARPPPRAGEARARRSRRGERSSSSSSTCPTSTRRALARSGRSGRAERSRERLATPPRGYQDRMSGSDESVQPSEQRGGSTPDAEEIREKGSWAGLADEGVVPAEEGGSDAPDELLGDDPELGSAVLGQTTGSDEPATEDGIDLAAGENADATTDGGPEPPVGVEPDLKDVAAAQRRADADSAG